MISVGIEAMNMYGGIAKLDLKLLAAARNLDPDRFSKLLMHEKTIAMSYEDPVSCAVNAAQPLIAALSDKEKAQIELLITCTESGIDFGKSLSTYAHDYLRLNRNCRLFEVKHMCYGGTAGLQMAANLVLSQTSPGAKALVIATDLTHLVPTQGPLSAADLSYAEPSFGAGAVALLISDQPQLLQLDVGCNGYYGYEVMDAGRPMPDAEWGDVDLSLLSYLDCCEHAYRHYQSKVEGVDYQDSFGYLAFHTPFGGMVKGAHQMMMRKFKANRPEVIEDDFHRRVFPSLRYCQQIGNVMSATVFMALAGVIDYGQLPAPQRVGIFSYGGGACSEFFSGVIPAQARARLAEMQIADHLAQRYPLNFAQYEQILYNNHKVPFGTRNVEVDTSLVPEVWQQIQGRGLLMLRRIKEFHREYEWV
ncbi:MAG: hydroxymethylglutaryl-CoA synthase family protein [Chloroflexota bacterium]|nr:hydroxymethylglutaryl-CoA synthase family protein [Chloroflexota bacterium]